MKTSIIIPNYNGFDLLQKNLPKVILAVGNNPDVSIVLVDDYSSKDEQEKLDEFVSKLNSKVPVTLLKHKKNKGFSSTVNTGAFHIPADLYILLNTDVVPQIGFVEKAQKHFEQDDNLFGVGFMDRSRDARGEVFRGRGIGRWEKGFMMHSKGDIDKTNTLWVSGGSSAIRGSMFRSIKGFDTTMDPFYWEDIDLSYRAQKRGYKTIFDKNITVDHFHDEGSIKKHYNKKKIMTIAYRNQFIFHWKNLTDISLIFSHVAWLPIHILRAVFSGDREFLIGFLLGLRKLPQILLLRFQNRHTKTDKKIINQDW